MEGCQMEKEVQTYRAQDGKEPFMDWLHSFRDKIIRQRIEARVHRIESGNYGDYKRLHGIMELRLHFGKGYRIYCGEEDDRIVILLAGGDKSTQEDDIKQALDYWRDYRDQTKI
jgi:putative addiction module killer protein